MKRPLALCLAVLLVAGCRGPGQTTDPFFGRTTVEPPRTGGAPGNRAGPYYSGAPAPSAAPSNAPRQPLVTAPTTPAPVAQPAYGSGSRSFVSSPTTPQPRLLPGSYPGPVAPPQVTLPAQPAPWSTAQPAPSPPPVTSAPAAAPATIAPALAPVPSQPTFSPPPAGPTLRPAAAIPAPAYQGQWCPNPATNLATRQRIVRPLQPRSACNPCPPGTVPVPCVPTYDPRRLCVPSTGPINITDLPEPK